MPVLVGNENIIPFHIAVNDVMLVQSQQGLQQLFDESANKFIDIQRRRQVNILIGRFVLLITRVGPQATLRFYHMGTFLKRSNIVEKFIHGRQTVLHADVDGSLAKSKCIESSACHALYLVLLDAEVSHDVRMIDRHDHVDFFSNAPEFLGIGTRQ
jgi:hypothetical protein